MIALNYNFSHPFEGKVTLRKTGLSMPNSGHMLFNSQGENDFVIPLDIKEDGQYEIILDWEYEGRAFYHQTAINICSGKMTNPESSNQ